MTRSVGAVVVLLVLAACGDRTVVVPPHGLTVDVPLHAPSGDAIEVGPPTPGTRVAEVDLVVTVRLERTTPSEGRARLEIEERTEAHDEGFRVHATVRVLEAEGPARGRVRGMDGLAFAVDLDAAGRPVEDSRRFLAAAPLAAQDFFERPWLAGFAGTTPWLPDRTVREGERWSVEDLGGPDPVRLLTEQARDQGTTLPEPRRTGGIAVDDVTDGGDTLALVMATLLESEGPVDDGALSLGLRTTGRATVDRATGRVTAWTCVEHMQLNAAQGERQERSTFVLRLQGLARDAD